MPRTRFTHLNIFLLFLVISQLLCLATSYMNRLQNATITHHYDIKGSAMINLETLLGHNLPYQITMHDNKACQYKPAGFKTLENIPFQGAFPNGGIPFLINGQYQMIKIEPKTFQVYAESYNLGNTKSGQPRHYEISGRHAFAKEIGSESELSNRLYYKTMVIFNTKSDLLIFNFKSQTSPILDVFPVHRSPILDFNIVNDKTLYVAAPGALLAYTVNAIEQKEIRDLAEFSGFALSNDFVQPIMTIGDIAVCDNVVYLAHGRQILAFQETTTEIFSSKQLPITKVINQVGDVIQMAMVGRSLMVITPKTLIEYVFVNDCLDLQENMRVANSLLGFDIDLTVSDRKTNVELYTSTDGNYFAILNKLKNFVYIFQSGTIKGLQDDKQPWIFRYDGGSERIESIALYDYFTGITVNGLYLVTHRQEDAVSVIVLQRDPTGLICTGYLAKTETMTVDAVARFCNLKMYNYTAFVEQRQKISQDPFYEDDLYFNPMQPCQKNLLLEIKFTWTLAMSAAAVVLGVCLLVVVLFVARMWWRRKSTGSLGHVQLEDEKRQGTDPSGFKMSASSLALPSATERAESGNSSSEKKKEEDYSVPLPVNQRKKNYTKKKNLTIRIPET